MRTPATATKRVENWSANSLGVKTSVTSVDSASTFVMESADGVSSTLERTAGADTTTRPHGLSPGMIDTLVTLAEQTGAKLVKEAQAALLTPMARKNVKLLLNTNGVAVFQRLRPSKEATKVPTPEQAHHQPKASKSAFSWSLWKRLATRRRRAGSRSRAASSAPYPLRPVFPTTAKAPPFQHVPRIFGVARVHVTLDELLDVVGHRSAHATTLLHPSMQQNSRRHALIDCVDEHVCVRSTTLRTPSSTVTEARDFLVVEHRHAFETPSGRRGYAVACHSVHWDHCPPPSEGAVRGSLYESGLVAIESEVDPETVELFCVAEMNLKGGATETENLDASCHRVIGTLARITQTIEERAKMLLSLDHTHVFHKARRANANVETCADCQGQLGQQRPYTCRKCYAKVCGDCSSIWQRGQKRMCLCMECWADAELNRTCGRALVNSYQN